MSEKVKELANRDHYTTFLVIILTITLLVELDMARDCSKTILLRDLGTTLELRAHIGVKKELTSKLYSHANLKKKSPRQILQRPIDHHVVQNF